MSTCQHLVLMKTIHQVKYFRLTDFRARRRVWSLVKAEGEGD